MSGQANWIVIGGSILAVLGITLAIIGLAEQNWTLLVIGLVATVAIIVGIVVLYRGAGRKGRAEFEQALASDFTASEQSWFHSSGLAIDNGRRVALLATATGVRRVPFDQLGTVTYEPVKIGPAFGAAPLLLIFQLPRAIGAMIHNATKAGLHVSAGGETTRIIGVQPKDAERWTALLSAARS